MAITLNENLMGTYPFEVFHISLGSTSRIQSKFKSD